MAYHQSRESVQTEVLSVVDWPIAESSGEVFDLGWLDVGTRKPVSLKEQAFIDRALALEDPSAILWAPGVPSYVRTEYRRQHHIYPWGARFLHQPTRILSAGMVRGAFYLEWGAHIELMKRTGHLEEALTLSYEVIDAAERVALLEGEDGGAAGWYNLAFVILRKVKDYDSEVRLIEDVMRRFPRRDDLSSRLATARRLAETEAKRLK